MLLINTFRIYWTFQVFRTQPVHATCGLWLQSAQIPAKWVNVDRYPATLFSAIFESLIIGNMDILKKQKKHGKLRSIFRWVECCGKIFSVMSRTDFGTWALRFENVGKPTGAWCRSFLPFRKMKTPLKNGYCGCPVEAWTGKRTNKSLAHVASQATRPSSLDNLVTKRCFMVYISSTFTLGHRLPEPSLPCVGL